MKPQLYVEARVTVQCHYHGSHTATARGPMVEVIQAMAVLRDVCGERDRWMVTEYRALDEPCAMAVSEWD